MQRLTALHPRKIDMSLGRMRRVLAAMDHPEKRLPPVIHVAGTNGKGSTIAFMRAMLEAAGYSVHVYTSPHLVRFHERIRLGPLPGHVGGGELINEAALTEALAFAEERNDGAPITVFEITTAAALHAFASRPADVLLLEVGLGGRLDATNVIDKPLSTVITPVSHDHAEYLGSEIDGIAREKAGIIKPQRPCVVGPQLNDALDAILAVCVAQKAPVFVADRDWQVREEHGRLVFEDQHGLLDLPLPRLPGRHQIANAGTAIATLRQTHEKLSERDIAQGVETAEWPARLQRVSSGPLLASLPLGSELWIDGGHNASAGKALAEALADLQDRAQKPLVLVCGMLNTKDPIAYLEPFSGLAGQVLTVSVSGSEAGIAPLHLAEVAQQCGIPAEATDGLRNAMTRAGDNGPARVVICGSLYLAGEALSLLAAEPA
ncbi:MAG: folylpolyglutamate synthase/dihydrofolate synthase family protein [Pseudomonadota bacterium]